MLWQYGYPNDDTGYQNKDKHQRACSYDHFPQKIPPSGFMLSSATGGLNIVVKNGVRSYLPFISPVYGSMYTDARLGLKG